MSKEGLLQEEPIELDIYGNDKFFQVAKKLAKPVTVLDRFCSNQRELIEVVLEHFNSDVTREEKAEVLRLLSTRDPIMWHLLCLHTNVDTNIEPPEKYLKKFILALIKDGSKIGGDYYKIISPRRWGRPLKEEYKEFQKFVDENMDRDFFFGILIFISSLLFTIALVAFLALLSK